MPRTGSSPADVNGIQGEVEAEILSHFEASDAQSVYTQANSDGLLIVLRLHGREDLRLWVVALNGTGPPHEPLPADIVLRQLLAREDLTDAQRTGIAAALSGMAILAAETDAESPLFWAFEDIPSLDECGGAEIEYLDAPLLPTRALIGITGDAGHGKSTLISALAARIASRGTPVVILDGDNPVDVVRLRLHNLRISEPRLRVWGRWCTREPAALDSPQLLHVIGGCNPKPLLVVDSLGGFFNGDENEAAQVRAFLKPAKALVNQGCTVVILHNTGKSTSSDYRGSAAFVDCLDVGYRVTNKGKGGLLDRLEVSCFKNRFGAKAGVVYNYADGACVRVGESPSVDDQNVNLERLLADNRGIGMRGFIAAAKAVGIPDHQAREFLNAGVVAGRIAREGSRGLGYRHSLVNQGDG